MAANVGYATLQIIPSLRGAQAKISSELGGAGDAASKTFGSKFGSGIKTAVGRVAKTTMVGAGAIAGVALVGGFKSAIDQQTGEKTLAGLYGSAKLASDTMRGLQQVSKTSPIDYSSYVGAAQSLAYAGVQGNDAISVLKNVGLAITAAGGSSENMGRATDALLKMVNAGKVSLDSLQQLSDAGVPILSGLAKHFDMSMSDVTAAASAGSIGLEDVLSVMQNATGDTFQSMTAAGEAASKSFGNQWKIAKDNVQVAIGTALLPALNKLTPVITKLGTQATSALEHLPALLSDMGAALKKFGNSTIGKSLISSFRDIANNAGTTASALKDALLPPLRLVAGAAIAVVTAGAKLIDVFTSLPKPVQTVAIQLGLAAAIMPRLNSAFDSFQVMLGSAGGSLTTFGQRIAQNRAAMTYQTTALGKAQAALHGLGGATRGIAGAAGMVGLTQSTQTSNKAIGALGKTASGALIGFSVGGPIGAAIGGGAGLLWGLADATKKSGNASASASAQYEKQKAAAQALKDSLVPLKDTLNQVTGAVTNQTRAAVVDNLQKEGLLAASNQLGIAQGVLVKAALGNVKAQNQMSSAFANSKKVLSPSLYAKVAAAAQRYGFEVNQGGKSIREANKAAADSKKSLAELNKSMTNVGKAKPDASFRKFLRGMTGGAERDTRKSASTITKNLTGAGNAKPAPKWLLGMTSDTRTAQRNTSRAAVTVNKNLRRAGDTMSGLQRWFGDVNRNVNGANRSANRGAAQISKSLRDGTGRARANLGPFNSTLSGGISTARGIAGSGGTGIGAALADGATVAINARALAVAGAAAGMVRDAVASARAAAKAKSPSRKMMALGNDMGDGLRIGIDARAAGVKSSLADLATPPPAPRVTASAPRGASVYTSTAGVTSQATAAARQANQPPRQLVLRVGDRNFTAYLEQISAGVMADRESMNHERVRAAW